MCVKYKQVTKVFQSLFPVPEIQWHFSMPSRIQRPNSFTYVHNSYQQQQSIKQRGGGSLPQLTCLGSLWTCNLNPYLAETQAAFCSRWALPLPRLQTPRNGWPRSNLAVCAMTSSYHHCTTSGCCMLLWVSTHPGLLWVSTHPGRCPCWQHN